MPRGVYERNAGQRAAITPWPRTRSPSIRHATCPGATPNTGSSRAIISRLCRPAAAAVGQPSGQRRGPVAQLDPVHAGAVAVQRRRAHPDVAATQVLAPTDDDAVGARIRREHVERALLAPDPEPAALPDREGVRAAVAPEDAAVAVDHVTRARPLATVAGEEAVAIGAGQEAQVLRVGLVRDHEPGRAGAGPHLGLAQRPEREAQPRQRGRRDRAEHVRLVLGRVGGGAQQRTLAVVGHARVVPGGQRRRAHAVGQREHVVQAHGAVAAHARVRRLARGVRGQERVDDAGAEAVPQVEREVRQAEPVRERPRFAHGRRRAARALGVVLRVGPQLDRHRDHVVARLGAEQRHDGRVDAAAHGHERAAGHPRRAPVGPGRGPERAVQRVGGQLGRVQLARTQAAELVGDVVHAHPRGLEQRAAAHERHHRRPRGLRGAAPGRVEARVGHVGRRRPPPRSAPGRRTPPRRRRRRARRGAAGRGPGARRDGARRRGRPRAAG